ncbi:hypothetical protein HJG60_010678 [Phyllostomus discolor]|uniref:Uncharacterized protein n=1 Tax=Phyllostomus discolor TaxID=89673 RepID=A0A834ALT2_9CHIR|nr:hypothetical protein HJG60_010678 [Phyllostomus discolor]
MKETWRRKFEGGSGARVRPGGEFPRGVDAWMETPAPFWLCGLKRRALGRLRPGGPGLRSAVGPGSFERRGDLADAPPSLGRGRVWKSGELGLCKHPQRLGQGHAGTRGCSAAPARLGAPVGRVLRLSGPPSSLAPRLS